MDGLKHESREGSRGGEFAPFGFLKREYSMWFGAIGSGSFKWEDIKTEKYVDYEAYLGHSVMAPIGRWQKNLDINWFRKSKDQDGKPSASHRQKMEQLRIERELIKQQEADLQAEAL